MMKFDPTSCVDTNHEIYSCYAEQDVIIGKYCSLAQGIIFHGATNHNWVKHRDAVSTFSFTFMNHLPYFEMSVSRGPIVIGNDVWIGRDVTILDGVMIGDGAIIGTKAVVSKDVPPYAVVVGNPGVIKHYRFTPEQIKKLLKIKWWDWSFTEIEQRIEDLKDINVFLDKYYKEEVKENE